jgi:hypothetical protein
MTESVTTTIESRDFERTAGPFKRWVFFWCAERKGEVGLWDDPGYVDLPQKKTLQPQSRALEKAMCGEREWLSAAVPSRHRNIHQTIALVQSMRCPRRARSLAGEGPTKTLDPQAPRGSAAFVDRRKLKNPT